MARGLTPALLPASPRGTHTGARTLGNRGPAHPASSRRGCQATSTLPDWAVGLRPDKKESRDWSNGGQREEKGAGLGWGIRLRKNFRRKFRSWGSGNRATGILAAGFRYVGFLVR